MASGNWHKPGNQQGNDAVPEFRAEVHPRGEAPAEHTFKPNPVGEFPRQDTSPGADTSALTPPEMPGATSKDVHTGFGLPLQGLESREVNPQLPGKKSTDQRAHTRGRKKEETGLVGVGVEPKKDTVRSRGLDLPEGVERGSRGKHTTDWPGAEERFPASADEVAAEQH
ncbi:unnamed protein product [Clonostachys chloroleuca]|uniref:Uncharacterized protein n=1 Tax=Clonostachys chloroleuca TaxID=1926264 RepID=A0AA35VUQ5_9HYPO|nr:unnamed protein product [Clonostachys chloroleuca]